MLDVKDMTMEDLIAKIDSCREEVDFWSLVLKSTDSDEVAEARMFIKSAKRELKNAQMEMNQRFSGVIEKGGDRMTELAKRIVRYRALNNLSQGEMARRCIVTKQTIWAIENGRQNPTKLTEAKIEEVLKNADI